MVSRELLETQREHSARPGCNVFLGYLQGCCCPSVSGWGSKELGLRALQFSPGRRFSLPAVGSAPTPLSAVTCFMGTNPASPL